MKFSRPNADVFSPQGVPPRQALARTTHLCVGAHQDDIEIMAQDAIAAGHAGGGKFFTGVVATDGAGSPRAGRYAGVSDAAMRAIRRDEQRRAAALGRYNLQIQLGHPSSAARTPGLSGLGSDLAAIFGGCRAETVYLHNPADAHDTHVALALRCLEALRALPAGRRPGRVLGCEVWRSLDWLLPADKVALDAGRNPPLAAALLQVFDSQIAGGKRYDLAALGRRAANATFDQPREADRMEGVIWAVDLTPLVRDPGLSVRDFTLALVDRLRSDVAARLDRLGGAASGPLRRTPRRSGTGRRPRRSPGR